MEKEFLELTLANGLLTPSICDIAIKSGMIHGEATRLKIYKNKTSPSELEAAMENIIKWAIEIKDDIKVVVDENAQRSRS